MDVISFSSMNMIPEAMEKYIQVLKWYKPDFIQGYASGVSALANYMNDKKVSIPVQAVLTGSDELTEKSRKAIKKAFGCKVYNEYGMNEETAAVECRNSNGMHIMMTNCLLEVIDEIGSHVFEFNGDIIGTNLSNYAMPFIRYRTGDKGILSKRECNCGWNTWMLEQLHGRSGDVMKMHGGQKMDHPSFSSWIYEIKEEEQQIFKLIREYQFHQVDRDTIIVNVITNNGNRFSPEIEGKMVNAIRKILFNDDKMTFIVKYPQTIKRGENGKFRCFLCDI